MDGTAPLALKERFAFPFEFRVRVFAPRRSFSGSLSPDWFLPFPGFHFVFLPQARIASVSRPTGAQDLVD